MLEDPQLKIGRPAAALYRGDRARDYVDVENALTLG
jgi:hypothetical protein